MSVLQKIAEIEAEMARTQKNKATAGHLGMLKAKLAKLRRELIEPSSGGGGGGGKGTGFEVKSVGDARVGFVGFPSVGKSTLLTTLSGTFSEAAEYEVCMSLTLHLSLDVPSSSALIYSSVNVSLPCSSPP